MLSPESIYKAEVDKSDRDQLILAHLEYVRHILSRTIAELPANVDRENLESAGVLGLVEAAQQFDPQRGVAFKTFAFSRIRGAILDELRRNSPLPQKMLQRIAQIREVCEDLPKPVTPESIVQATGLSLEEVESALAAMRLRRIQTWEDTTAFLGGITDGRQPGPERAAEENESRRVLAQAIERLPEKERLVITLYHLEELRLREIGDVLKLSESRVSRLLSKAEFRLSQMVRERGG